MGAANASPAQVITLPQGGGALRGLAEKFSADLLTGAGRLQLPIDVPPGRGAVQPQLALTYSTQSPNGVFGLGWSLNVPAVSRQTAHGVPRYRDDRDTFVLSGTEDLVRVGAPGPDAVRYRPRTEGMFARIVHRRTGEDSWQLRTKDGLVSTYATPVADPRRTDRIFAWRLSRTEDPLGNALVYGYGVDAGEERDHRWSQPLLERMSYADAVAAGSEPFLATVALDYEERDDPFSDYRPGFELRTSRRCRSLTTATHFDRDRLVRRYEFEYAPEPYSGVSLLTAVHVVAFDDAGAEHRDLPPLELGYSPFEPRRRRLRAVTGREPPATSLAHPGMELTDVDGDGLPDVLQLDGVARYWHNRGDGTLDPPRPLHDVPGGVSLAQAGVQLLDADGDARPDVVVTAGTISGYFPLRRVGGRRAFVPYRQAPSFDLEDPQVRFVDLDGGGITDAVRGGLALECFFNDPGQGWSGPVRASTDDPDGLPEADFAGGHLRFADMNGDGLKDLALVHQGGVVYWPNLGRGRFGRRVHMTGGPRLLPGHDPGRLLVDDLDGDGVADLALVADDHATIWINRNGNGWSEPIEVRGTPLPGEADAIRCADVLGTGVAGIVWSRDAGAPGRPALHVLDLTGGVKPRLLARVENNVGATTSIAYAPSSRFAPDSPAPVPTSLPFVVPVVSRVEAVDAVSGGKLVSEYRYLYGHWDGEEREFRGFGCVEEREAQTFEDLQAGLPARAVGDRTFSPPTLRRTWFHLGAVEQRDGRWRELDWSATLWPGDRQRFGHAARIDAFLDDVGEPGRTRARRDALRCLRGNVLRTELYGLDGSDRAGRAYTVTECAYAVREEPAAERRVFFPHLIARRTTEWQRGDDPLTRVTYLADYDDRGNARRSTTVDLPRRSSRRTPVTAAAVGTVAVDETRVLALHTRTSYAGAAAVGDFGDRVADVRSYELRAPPAVREDAPDDVVRVIADQLRTAEEVRATFERLDRADVVLVNHVVNHYDGPGHSGLPVGEIGAYGVLSRTERLMFTDADLVAAYGDWLPTYLRGPAPPPPGAPTGFGTALGYRFEPGGSAYAAGWYADTARRSHDFQSGVPGAPARGLVLAMQDPLGRETRVVPDPYWLLPARVVDPVGLETGADYDYRLCRPRTVTDPNGHRTQYRYHALGMLSAVFLQGRDGEGGREDAPELRYEYDFGAFARTGTQPISVHATRRVHHAREGVSDEVVQTREFSDGFGRLVQTRSASEALRFGDTGDAVGLLVADAGGRLAPVPGRADPTARGAQVADAVTVSGWRTYDNKGQVVECFEPFHATGFAFSEEEARRGRRSTMSYDARSRMVATRHSDGSEQRVVFGVPPDLANPGSVAPTAWAVTTYDPNDLAPLSRPRGGLGTLAAAAPAAHHFTPATVILDARSRTRARVARNGADPQRDWFLTRTTYDIRDNVLEVTDPLGRVADRHAYDLADRVLRIAALDAGVRTSVPDACSNIVEARDDRGAVVLQTYDALNRPERMYARDGAGGRVTLREALTYGDGGTAAQPAVERALARADNRLGRIWRHLDEAGEMRVERYDFKGNVVERSRVTVRDDAIAAGWTADWEAPGAGAALEPGRFVTTRRHDALNRVTRLTAPTDPTGARAAIAVRHGPSGAVVSTALDDEAVVAAIAYNARRQPVLLAFGNGVMTRFAYDADTFRLVRLRTEGYRRVGDTFEARGPVLQEFTYAYDLAGNVVSIEDRTPGCGIAATPGGRDRLIRVFEHDPLYRLVRATGRECTALATPRAPADLAPCGAYTSPFVAGAAAPGQGNAPDLTSAYTESYEFDPVGNLVRLRHLAEIPGQPGSWRREFGSGGAPAGEWTGATSNRLTSFAQGAATGSFGHDLAGNLASQDTTRTYGWDHAGRLTTFSISAGGPPSVRARYLYGADGNRVKKWVRRGDAAASDESSVYVDGVFERERWAAGARESAWIQVALETAVPARFRRGPAHPDDAGPPVRYHVADHLGSVACVVGGDGLWVNREEFFPGGEASFGGFRRKRFRHTGRERDEESGLQYHGARYYAPWLHRWTSPEPLLLMAPPDLPEDASSPYAYADGRWMAANDPDGRAINLAAAAGGAALGFVIGGAFELGRQWYKNEPLDLKRAGAVAVGGAIAGGMAGLTMGASLVTQAAVAGLGSAAGGTVTRTALGEKTTAGDLAWDFGIGVATFGVAKGMSALRSRSSNELMKNAIRELEASGVSTVPSKATPLQGAAFYSEVLAEDFRRSVVQAAPEAGQAPARAGKTVLQLPRSKMPSKVAAGVDRTTGEIRYGASGENRVVPHPDMDVPAESLVQGRNGPVRCNQCAEYAVSDRQLWGGGAVQDLAVTTLETESGAAVRPCPNCQVTSAGAEFTTPP